MVSSNAKHSTLLVRMDLMSQVPLAVQVPASTGCMPAHATSQAGSMLARSKLLQDVLC